MPQNSDDQDRPRADLAASENTQPESPGQAETPDNEGRMKQTRVSELSDLSATDSKDVPAQFGRYRIERELGRGGMGAVYLAHDEHLDRKVALKVPFFKDDDEVAVQRFQREARAMATVQHANLCPVYDVGHYRQWHFLTMAFIDGLSLSEKLKQDGAVPLIQATQLMKAVANALQKAHESGIVHRDLKPANIMLNQQLEPIIMDFGLARRQSTVEIELTHNRAVLGSPAYMAPEQVEARHDEVGPATDVYAMGIILYQMVAGRRPYEGSLASIFGQIVSKEPDPPSMFCTHLPVAIDALCLKAIAKSPSQRHGSAAEFANDLSRYLADQGSSSPTMDYVLAKNVSYRDSQSDVGANSDHVSTTHRSRDAERRQLTVMICNCDTIDPEQSLMSLDPEDQRDVLEAFQRQCEDATNRFGGTIVQSTGQELLVCFGFPTAYEDSPHRAIRTGLRILEEMKLLNEVLQGQKKAPLSAWAAIHTGMVVVGESSSSESQIDTLSIIGEARTVTSRLEALTEPEQILISDSTHRLVQGSFVCESQGTQKIRGVSRPVELFQVLGENDERSMSLLVDDVNLTPLVGRDAELGIIKDRWEHAVDGVGQVVLLIGEAGMGKSRLVSEIKEHVANEDIDVSPHVIEWRCSAYHEGSSLYPVIDFFERHLEFARGDTPQHRLDLLIEHLQEFNLNDPEQIAVFAALLSIPADDRCASIELAPARQKARTQELLLDWFREFSSLQPVLFIVEDLHWVDPSTLEFLTLHIDQGVHNHVLTLLSFRPEFRTPWQSYSHLTQVALTRLTKRQIGEMIKRKTGVKNVPQEIVAKLVERTDGVPLFVEEFTQMVDESGALDSSGKAEDIALALNAIPVTLQDLMSARLDRLNSNPDVVQLGATFGREFTYELLQVASDLEEDELQSELIKLVESELLFQKGRLPQSSYTFKHALIQDAAYGSMLKQKRQQYHKKIAAAIESNSRETVETQPELLAYHATEAGEAKKAVPYWLQAGQHAQRRSANAEAINHLTQGLEVLKAVDESPLRNELELGLQATLAPVLMAARGWSAPEVGSAIERAQQLVSEIGTLEDQFFVMWGLWGWRIIRSDMDICAEIAADIIQLLEQSSEGRDLMAEAHWVLGATAYYKGDFKTGLELLEKGLELVDDEKERAHSLKTGQRCSLMCRSHTALALWQLGYPDQALQRAEETIQLGKELEHPFTFAMGLFFRRQVLEFCGLHDQAHASIEEEYNICHENGFVFFEVHAVFGRGDSLLRDGKIDEAREQFDLGLTMLKATGGNLSMDHPYRNIAEGYLLAGLHDEASEWLNRGFDLVNNCNERGMESEFLRLQGALALATDDEQSAEESYQRAVQVAQRQHAKSWELRAMISFAELKKQQGKQPEAQQMLDRTYRFFSEGFDTVDLIKAKVLLNELGAKI